MKVKQAQSQSLSSLSILLGLASPSYFTSARSLRQHTRIINETTKAVLCRYSYFVSLQDELYGHQCRGSRLIAADVILTSAHCESPDYLAIIKRHDLDNISNGTAIPVKGSLPHPNYDWNTIDNDFMLLFLRDPAPQYAAFVKLNSKPNAPAAGDNVTVMVHGLTDPDGMEISEELLEAGINVVLNDECDYYSHEGNYEYIGWSEYGSLWRACSQIICCVQWILMRTAAKVIAEGSCHQG